MTKQAQLNNLITVALLIVFYTFLVMTIWNNIIVVKFPASNIQKLSFTDSLGLALFVSLLGVKNIF